MPLSLLIIGAGVAGLSTAIATKLASPQTDILILESAKILEEVGVCYNLPR